MLKSITISRLNPFHIVESNVTIVCNGAVDVMEEVDAHASFEIPYGNVSSKDLHVNDSQYQTSFIHFNERFYSLREPLICEVDKAEGVVTLTCTSLDITVWGSSFEQAVDALNFAFDSAYRAYALEDDANLTEQAKGLKNRLLELVAFSM